MMRTGDMHLNIGEKWQLIFWWCGFGPYYFPGRANQFSAMYRAWRFGLVEIRHFYEITPERARAHGALFERSFKGP